MTADHQPEPARAVGFNHIAIEVGNLDKALEFYGKIFKVKLRGRHQRMAFIDMGDQFLAVAETGCTHHDGDRHLGLVVDDQAKALAAAKAAGADFLAEDGNDFLDPWGNRFQVVQYSEVQFTKTPEILRTMGMADLEKSRDALEELREKGVKVA